MVSLFRNSCKKFNFIHQTVSPREAHLGWTQNLTKGAFQLLLGSIYITLTHAVAIFHFDQCINNINFNSTVIPAGALVLPVASFVYVTLPPGKVWIFTTGCDTKQAGHSQTLITLFICWLQE